MADVHDRLQESLAGDVPSLRQILVIAALHSGQWKRSGLLSLVVGIFF